MNQLNTANLPSDSRKPIDAFRTRMFVALPHSMAAMLFAVAMLPVLVGCQAMQSQTLNVEGTQLTRQGNYQAALQRFSQAIAADPTNPDGYYNLAATYHQLAKVTGQQQNAAAAEQFYNQALTYDPQNSEAHRGLAVLLTETNRADSAQRLMENWVATYPTSSEARIELARLRDEFGDKESAKRHLLEAIELDPNNARALTALGKLREESGETLQALAVYQRSLSADKFQAQVAERVASLQTSLGLPISNTTTASTPAPMLGTQTAGKGTDITWR